MIRTLPYNFCRKISGIKTFFLKYFFKFKNYNYQKLIKKNIDVLRPRHRLRMALVGNFGTSLIRSIFESIPIMITGVAYGLVTGRFSLTWGHLSSVWWNLKRLKSLNSMRGRIRENHAVAIRNRGSLEPQQHSFRRAVIGQAPSGTGPEALTRIRFHQLWAALLGPGGIALLVAGVILGFGSRYLLSEGLPVIGRFQLLPADPLDLFRSWWYGWRSTATGMETESPFDLWLDLHLSQDVLSLPF